MDDRLSTDSRIDDSRMLWTGMVDRLSSQLATESHRYRGKTWKNALWFDIALLRVQNTKKFSVSRAKSDFPVQSLPSCLHARSPCLKQVLTTQTKAIDDLSEIPQLGCIFGIQLFSDAHLLRSLQSITSSVPGDTL
jgi:hypothetical protein